MSQRYSQMFSSLKARQEGAFVPFVTIGDPDLATSERIIRTLIDAGADALELGLPFSDPVADGPVIQAANIRALRHHITTQQCFDLLARIRADYPEIPIGLLVYCNLVVANGTSAFYQRAAQAGVDSVLIADVPLREGVRFIPEAQAQGIAPIFIAPPDASEATLKGVAQASEGYIYLLSRSGVTGANDDVNAPAAELIKTLNNAGGAPALLGFGIARPEHVQAAIAAGAGGAISGSAVVRIIAEHEHKPEAMLTALAEFVRTMKAATQAK
ncbi:tryptophan synthase subunit alpha [Aliidiomarina halalkaliphila]|uniref:Tryptophan synthase alpha chain n=1 Tax=Aliidiomarina halalkaliphila TaxID=2593535 RepID=A0A552X4X4_9GAMM|nr:tryptophan synthase subunit alpha [Aliidiomarina halalkaliphila]TRW50070.1 tryptophan synthase subunit alpha [Aliidiomarina halalkaliphila]